LFLPNLILPFLSLNFLIFSLISLQSFSNFSVFFFTLLHSLCLLSPFVSLAYSSFLSRTLIFLHWLDIFLLFSSLFSFFFFSFSFFLSFIFSTIPIQLDPWAWKGKTLKLYHSNSCGRYALLGRCNWVIYVQPFTKFHALIFN
jgi:hypothetical protein